MINLDKLKVKLSSPQKIVITTHIKPDADALGSSLALWGYLKKLGHDVQVITPTDYPRFIWWMHGNDEVMIYTDTTEASDRLINDADLIFCLDFSCLQRISDMGEIVRQAKGEKVLIDHHIDPEDFAEYVLWSTKASSTAELIYDFILLFNDYDKLDKHIAESIYAGIMTDTGSFRFPCTTKKTHQIIAELIEVGADNGKVHRLVYDDNSLNRLKFLGFALSEKLVVLEEYKVAYFAISAKELEQFSSENGDTEGVVNYALSMNNIVFAAFIKESDGIIKMSFRSKGTFAVNEFSRDHFEGGGHKNAAGGKSDLTLEETIQKVRNLLPQYKEAIEESYQNLNK